MEEDWREHEVIALHKLKDLMAAGSFSTPASVRKGLAELTLREAIDLYERQLRSATPYKMKIVYAQHLIPNRDALDKILRYETTTERSLDRAHNRLERLQRRRKDEPALPPVNVQLAGGSLLPTKPRPTEENEVAQDESKIEVKADPDGPGYIEMS